MTNEVPDVKADGHYSVSMTAKLLGICRKTLYNHAAKNHIKCHYHRYTKKPFYTGREIIRFWGAQY